MKKKIQENIHVVVKNKIILTMKRIKERKRRRNEKEKKKPKKSKKNR